MQKGQFDAEAPTDRELLLTRANQRRRVHTVLSWGFPLVSLLVSLGTQILVPRILLIGLSSAEYTAYVAVSAVAGYIGLADSGLFLPIVRELSARHGAADADQFAAEGRRARWIFAGMGLLGALIAGACLPSALAASESGWPGAISLEFVCSSGFLLMATALMLSCGSFHTAMLSATGRYLGAQLAGVASQVIPLGALVAALGTWHDLGRGIAGSAGALAVVALLRGVHAELVLRREMRGVALRGTPSSLRRLVGAGLMLKLADNLPSAAFPHLLTVAAPEQVPIALPARAYANACRLMAMQFYYLLLVHLTRRLAGSATQVARGLQEYNVIARFLTATHLMQIGIVALVARPVFQAWLPGHEHVIQQYLPGLLAEQALLSVAIPSSALFVAKDRMNVLGGARVIGIVVGLISLPLLLRTLGPQAFGWALALSALPWFLLSLWAEGARCSGFPAATGSTIARYTLALVALVACIWYSSYHRLAALVVFGSGCFLLLGSFKVLWRLIQERLGSR